ncbi:MAG TPA: HlyD family efflux transporter periplasmic adaptor subunit [bacterium]|nr:HlyD family efflux transporter periplasmic adaptor subunit [bacterium]
MSKLKSVIFIFLLLLIGCSNQDGKSDAFGNFEADETIISAQSSGEILAFNIEEGEKLKKGEQVAVIDTTQLVLQREQLQQQIAGLEASISTIERKIEVQKEQRRNLKIEKKRLRKLKQDSAATEKQWDQIIGQLRVSEANLNAISSEKQKVYHNIKASKAKLGQVNDKIEKCYVTNPIDGTVLEKYINQYEVAASGKPLYKIANLNQVYLRAYVSGAQLSEIKIGEQVKVIIDKNETENQSLNGKITWIADDAEFTPKIIQTKDVRVDLVYAIKILVQNDGRIKIGMPGEVVFNK